jgi:hypothetical protein
MDKRYETFNSDLSSWCVIDTWQGNRYVKVAPETTFVDTEAEADRYARELNDYQEGHGDR